VALLVNIAVLGLNVAIRPLQRPEDGVLTTVGTAYPDTGLHMRAPHQNVCNITRGVLHIWIWQVSERPLLVLHLLWIDCCLGPAHLRGWIALLCSR
jgi:hypothetical protein